RTMHRCEVHSEARVPRQPRAYLLAAVHAEVVTYQVNESDLTGRLAVNFLQQFDEFGLTFAAAAQTDDLARAGIERREEVQSSLALIFMLQPYRHQPRPGRSCRRGA